jgi:hypothetical protein
MGRIFRRSASVLVACSIVWAVPVHASAVTTDRQRALAAGRFLVASQKPNGSFPGFSPIGSTADAVLDLVALGRGTTPLGRALGFLRRQVSHGHADTIGLQAKVALAAEAAGRDPAHFGGDDLITDIRATKRASGRFGTASVLDQALALLALRGAGIKLTSQPFTWLADAQCPDGGWQYDRPHRASEGPHCFDRSNPHDFTGSDSNTTAYAIMALRAAASPQHDPFRFLAHLRDTKPGRQRGGWGFTWGFRTTDANSTALVLQAYAVAGKPLPARSRTALRALQYPCGAVAYSWTAGGARTGRDVGATIGAILGFLRAPIPPSGAVSGDLARTSCPT